MTLLAMLEEGKGGLIVGFLKESTSLGNLLLKPSGQNINKIFCPLLGVYSMFSMSFENLCIPPLWWLFYSEY